MVTETSSDVRDFHEQLKAILPRLRIYALSLTRDRDAAILKAIFLDERDKDDICDDYEVTRSYLRVLVHRALELFRELYRKH